METDDRLSLYRRVMDNRPFKMSRGEAGYRQAAEDEIGAGCHCRDCIHFFTRRVDGLNTCEIYRDEQDEQSIEPNYVCRYFTADGEEFPLLQGERENGD